MPSPEPASSQPAPQPKRPPQPKPAPSPPARSPQPPSTPVGMRPASGAGGSTAIVPRPEEPPRPPPKRRSPLAGPLIVVSAVLLALVIVGLGFLVRSWMTREQDSRERSRHIQERLEQIRNAEQ